MSKRKAKRKIITQKPKEKDNSAQIKVLASRRNILILLISLSLIVVTFAVFWPVRNHTFLNYDDYEYVVENSHVKAGLTFKGLIWAFTTTHSNNWHPLTWLSHMLDYELFGLRPGEHHLTNLLFHLTNTLLLFLVFKRMTGGLWESSFVAALFALHPLHVESVAWVAERKDVLSTFFWMLTMWTYIRYTEEPKLKRYLLVLLSFTLGLLSKPMLVTIPFVLLLLDYWPLGRFQFGHPSGYHSSNPHKSRKTPDQRSVALRLILEKTPFFALTTISSFLTIFAQRSDGVLRSLKVLPLQPRIANSLISYVSYIEKMIWPDSLAIFYPYPNIFPLWQVAGAGLLLTCVSVLAIYSTHKRPYLLVGWLWYLGTLVPVIGLVQVGSQALADRYTYVPLIGLFIMIAWGVPSILKDWCYRRIVLAVLAGLLLSIFMIVTRLQILHWHNSITLFEHALDVTAQNHQAHNILGMALSEQGKIEEAIVHYNEALRIKPDFAKAHNNLGRVLARQGKIQEAIAHYTKALQIDPNYTEVHKNIGRALAREGKIQEAIVHYTEALRIDPHDVEVHNNLGIVLTRQGRFQEAIIHITEALRIEPNSAEIYINLGNIFAEQGKIEEAIFHYTKALRIKPNFAEAHFSLSLAYWEMGDRSSALKEYEILKTINPDLANNLFQKIFK
jgi:Flp pilus assembly protein TadD